MAPPPVTGKLLRAQAAVEAACVGRDVSYGHAWEEPDHRIWVTASDVSAAVRAAKVRDGVELFDPLPETLQRAGRAGLIIARHTPPRSERGRGSWDYTTLALYAEAEAERNLPDDARAARTAESVRARYEANRITYGDKVGLWSAEPGYHAKDGVQQALAAGLIVEDADRKTWNPGERRYVPADYVDAWTEALQDEADRAARMKAVHDDLRARLTAFAGDTADGRERSIVELTPTQVRTLLALLGQTGAP